MGRRKLPGKGLIRAVDHARKVVDGLPAFEPWLAKARATELDLDREVARVRALVEAGDDAVEQGGVSHRRLAGTWSDASDAARSAYAWTKAVRRHLRVATDHGGPEAREAAREVRRRITLKTPRFEGALAQVRRLVPVLEDRARWLEVYPGASLVRGEGEALRSRLETMEGEIVTATAEADRWAVRMEVSRGDLERAVETLERTWGLAHSLVPGLVPWPFGRAPWVRVRRRRAATTAQRQADAVAVTPDEAEEAARSDGEAAQDHDPAAPRGPGPV